ncbi:MAG: FliM/FliN family flagellar motor switch protein [Ruminococcus sp.]|jgi:flagellar motor switch protein FliN/FliY|nr:FliM/FliN family flagellar motor switch protein [Ruminococcus sp.]
MKNFILNDSDIDAAGEILGIGMGSAANTISSILDKPVSIAKNSAVRTTGAELDLNLYQKGVFANCNFTSGIVGGAGLLFTADSTCKILNVLMSSDLEVTDDFQFDEMGIGTIQEIYNMMMQTFTRTVGEFVNASPEMELSAKVFDLGSLKSDFKISDDTEVTLVNFTLDITGVVNTNFDFVISPEFAQSLKEKLVDMGMSVAETPDLPQTETAPPPTLQESVPYPAIQPEVTAPQQPTLQESIPYPTMQPEVTAPQQPTLQESISYPAMQPEMTAPQQPILQGTVPYPAIQPQATEFSEQDYAAYYEYYKRQYEQYSYQLENDEENKILKATEEKNKPKIAEFPTFNLDTPTKSGAFIKDNMNMLMEVKVNVVAEMGKVKRKMKDIMEFEVGTVIELDKSAGTPCEIIVNTQLVGKGDVIVWDDNFWIRIVDIFNTYGEQKKKAGRR